MDGTSGLLVPEGDVDGIAAGLGRLDQDEAFRRELASAGRTRVADLHDAEQQTARLVAHYRAILAGTAPDAS